MVISRVVQAEETAALKTAQCGFESRRVNATNGGVAQREEQCRRRTLVRHRDCADRRMTVICRGFESRRLHFSPVARSDEHSPSNREVAGSTPAGATNYDSADRSSWVTTDQPGALVGSSPERDGAQLQHLSAVP
jgi:hypothetical protein